MQQSAHEPRRRLARSLALALALLSLVFLLQVTPHGHANGHDEAACRLCQAAHLGVVPTVSSITASVPLVPVSEVATLSLGIVSESFLSHSDPRAPPLAVL
jgi:hypothetical protein